MSKINLTQTKDYNDRVTSYTYDPVGNRTGLTYPDGTSDTLTYDMGGNLNRLTESDGEVTNFELDAYGRPVKMEYPNGEGVEYSYNELDQLTEKKEIDLNGRIKISHRFDYDEVGNITNEYHTGMGHERNATTFLYRYDQNNRLTQTTESIQGNTQARVTNYAYDSAGNISRETVNGQAINYSYNNLNQLTGKVDGTDGGMITTYEYDGRGNLVREVKPLDVREYEYDSSNRLRVGTSYKGGVGRLSGDTGHSSYTTNSTNNTGHTGYTGYTVGGVSTHSPTERLRSGDLGSLENLETSEYIYNGIGQRVEHIQTINNPNLGYRNNSNGPASESAGGAFDDLALEFRPIDIQKTFVDNLRACYLIKN